MLGTVRTLPVVAGLTEMFRACSTVQRLRVNHSVLLLFAQCSLADDMLDLLLSVLVGFVLLKTVKHSLVHTFL